jgi:hypothetical protein
MVAMQALDCGQYDEIDSALRNRIDRAVVFPIALASKFVWASACTSDFRSFNLFAAAVQPELWGE